MARVSTEEAFPVLLGEARHRAYVDAAGGSAQRAAELYEWSTKLAGAWHSHIGYIEVAVRNAIDRELAIWNASQTDDQGNPYGPDWTVDGGAAPLLFRTIEKPLNEARENARKEAQRRPRWHARRGAQPNHDDVVAQLSFGSWSRLVTAPQGPEKARVNASQILLWEQALSRAFPGAVAGEPGRVWVGNQLEGIRRLRNRIAHHDNLLDVDTTARLNGSLALLVRIHTDFPALVMGPNTLRQLAAADPRLQWGAS